VPVAVTESVALCPRAIVGEFGPAVIAGGVQEPPEVTVIVAVVLFTKPQEFDTRTQTVVVDEGATVIEGPVVIGEEVLPLTPAYHWYVIGAVPVAVTEIVALWPRVIVGELGPLVIAGGVQPDEVTVIVAVELLTNPQEFDTRTQTVVVDEGATVIEGPVAIGEEVLGLAPAYHWYVSGAVPVAVTEIVALWPRAIVGELGPLVIAGGVQPDEVTVIVAVELFTKPQEFDTRTHTVVVDDGETVTELPVPMGEDVLPLAPAYHWYVSGAVPVAVTEMVALWPALIVGEFGPLVITGAVHDPHEPPG
jgi:hypothetical protein